MKKLMVLLVLMVALVGCGAKNTDKELPQENEKPTVEVGKEEEVEVEIDGEFEEDEVETGNAVENVKQHFDYDTVNQDMERHVMMLGGFFPELDEVVDPQIVVDETLFDGTFAIAIGKQNSKVVVFDYNIEGVDVPLQITLDKDYKVVNAQPFFGGPGNDTYADALASLEAGNADGSEVSFNGDAFARWAE